MWLGWGWETRSPAMKRASIRFIETKSAITTLSTKFGGQPVWAVQADWPLSQSTNVPMRFIGQVRVEGPMFPKAPLSMAYIFMADEGEGWDPTKGDNKVILQPIRDESVASISSFTGPSLEKSVKSKDGLLGFKACEYRVNLSIRNDPDREPLGDGFWWWLRMLIHSVRIAGNKLGGVPFWVQDEEYPFDEPCYLLLQLDSTHVPFYINFGDNGTGYVFILEDASEGRFLWQCL